VAASCPEVALFGSSGDALTSPGAAASTRRTSTPADSEGRYRSQIRPAHPRGLRPKLPTRIPGASRSQWSTSAEALWPLGRGPGGVIEYVGIGAEAIGSPRPNLRQPNTRAAHSVPGDWTLHRDPSECVLLYELTVRQNCAVISLRCTSRGSTKCRPEARPISRLVRGHRGRGWCPWTSRRLAFKSIPAGGLDLWPNRSWGFGGLHREHLRSLGRYGPGVKTKRDRRNALKGEPPSPRDTTASAMSRTRTVEIGRRLRCTS